MKPQELKVGSFYSYYEDLVLLLSKFDENDGYFILNFLRLSDGQVVVGEFSNTVKYNLSVYFNVGDFFMYEDFNDNGNMIYLHGLVVSAKNSNCQDYEVRKIVFLELDGTLCSGDYRLGCPCYDLIKIDL